MDTAALIGEVGTVLGSLGLGLQFLRQFRWFHELLYSFIAVGLAVAAVWFVHEGPFGDRRTMVLYFIHSWPLLLTYLGVVLGGTKLGSDSAKVAVEHGANSDHPMIPVTNSKA